MLFWMHIQSLECRKDDADLRPGTHPTCISLDASWAKWFLHNDVTTGLLSDSAYAEACFFSTAKAPQILTTASLLKC